VSIALDCLVRDGYRCFKCGRPLGGSVPWNCHHRLSSSLGPDTPDNRITLCGFGNNRHDADGREWCHGAVHQASTEARANGWIISRHATRPPSEVPVVHWQLGEVTLTVDGQIIGPDGRAVMVA
jgi:hypothetical protein